MTIVMVIGMLLGVPANTMKVEAATTVGGFTIEGGISGTDYVYDSGAGVLTIQTATPLTITTSEFVEKTIYIKKDADITLAGVQFGPVSGPGIQIADNSGGNVMLRIKGYNYVEGIDAPGIEKNGVTSTLTIDDVDNDDTDDDELVVKAISASVYANYGPAAIGGNSNEDSGNITINGGTVVAVADSRGAAIGGGTNASGSNITITGGNVQALVTNTSTKKDREVGAAIGGGYAGNGSNIRITGGTVLARFVQTGDTGFHKYIMGQGTCRGGAAIGGGYNGSASNITISGGTVTALGGSGVSGAAGIGAGGYGGATGILIEGGMVTANGGGYYGAGIGSGEQEAIAAGNPIKNIDVTITGGTVVAKGASRAPGIGAGQRANAYVYISGGSVHATRGNIIYDAEADDVGFGCEQNADTTKKYVKNVVYSKSEQNTTTNKVTLVEKKYQSTANTSMENKLGFRYSDGTEYTYNTTGMVTDANGYIYAYLPSDVEIYEKSESGDTTPPTGTINIDSHDYSKVNMDATINECILSNNQVTITASDTHSGIKSIQYGFASDCYAESAIESRVSWMTYSAPFTFPSDETKAVYAKITDKSGNVTYLSSPVIYNDTVVPVNSVNTSNVTSNGVKVTIGVTDVCQTSYAYVVLPADAAAPTDWDSLIKKFSSGKGGRGSFDNGGGTVTKTLSGLNVNTAYKLYVISRNELPDMSGNVTTNTSDITELSFMTTKLSANVSNQEYEIKAGITTTNYTYDLTSVLAAAGVDVANMTNPQYTCTTNNGSILSASGSLNVNNGKITIPVHTNLAEGLSQNIAVTITSDNYETIAITLTVKTIGKTAVALSGVSVSDVVYNGNKHPYKGTITWKANGVNCVDAGGTDVTYVGVDGTNYPSSGEAPTDAGTYRVTFTVKSNNTEYVGTQSYQYTIAKASLDNVMSDVAWYIDGEKISSEEDAKVTENGNVHQVGVQGYPSEIMTPQYSGTRETASPGSYTTTASFKLAEAYARNYDVPDSMTLNWQIVDRITPDMSAVKWIYKQGTTQNTYREGTTNLYVNGAPYTVEVVGLPEGITAKYTGTCTSSAAGNYTANVTFEVTDSTKYKNPEITSMRLSWSIHKHTATVQGQTYTIKSDISTTQYQYDVNDMLSASEIDKTAFVNLTYECTKGSGSILSGNPTVDSRGLMTIPVNAYLAENISQSITVVFRSNNYETIYATLNVSTVARTTVTLSGVSVSNTIYDGNQHPYTGTISWKANGVACVDASGTTVTYIGIDGTNYPSSKVAPVGAGNYRVDFVVNADNAEYKGSQSYEFKILKANLTPEMSNVAWYIDGTSRVYSPEDAKITEDGNTHQVVVKGYPEDKVKPVYSGTYSTDLPGTHLAVVDFELTPSAAANYNAPQSMSLDWEIVDRITPDMSSVQWVYKQGTIQGEYEVGTTNLYVNGAPYTVEVIGLPEGVTAQYTGTCTASAAGNYTANVTFTVTDPTKYKNPENTSMRLSWSIHKNTATVQGQTYIIKSDISTTQYQYDVNDILSASGLDRTAFENLIYDCTRGAGDILSNNPTVDSQGLMTIPVNMNLADDMRQSITVIFRSDNYETIYTTLDILTVAKTTVALSGVSVSNTVYDGKKHPYAGTITWKINGEECVDASGTDVTYVGVDGTDYASSGEAPTDAGTYRVTFTVKSSNTEYVGTQSYQYTIAKASLDDVMSDVAWYIDGKKISSAEDAKVTENGNVHQVGVQGYPSEIMTPQYSGTYGTSAAGYYTATVRFHLTQAYAKNYDAPNSMTLNWQIVDRITPNMSAVKWIYKQGTTQNTYKEGITNLYVNGTPYTVEVTGLPEGITAQYTGTCTSSAAGNYTANVTFEVTDSTKYKNPEVSSMHLSWKINKNATYVSGQTYWIKAGESITTYNYNVNDLLTASGLNASMFDNLSYRCTRDDGNILSSNPTINEQGVMTIPVKQNLAADTSQNITVTFMSDNYTDTNVVLTVKTIAKTITQLNLSGVTVQNTVYNGQAQGYSGDIVWRDGSGKECIYADGTTVTYVGVNGTSYNSTNAPKDAGTYQVVFKVENVAEYIGSVTYQYTIDKASLTSEMSNVQWCIDGNRVNVDNAQVLYDGNVHTVSIENYPDAYVTPLYVSHQKIALGDYTTIVNFELNGLYEDNYYIPDSIELNWQIVEEIEEVIEKITPDMSSVKWVYKQDDEQKEYVTGSTKLIANDKAYAVEVIGLPEGVTVEYDGTCNATVAGTYQATAIFDITDVEKYNQPEPSKMVLEWGIEKTPEEEAEPLPAVGTPIPHKDGNYKVTSATADGGTVEYVGPKAKKSSLKTVEIPATIVAEGKTYVVTSIAKNALSGCKKLTKVKIPNGITSIGANAFKGCEKLTTIKIPNSVTSIGSSAFSGCKKLKTVSFKSASKLTKIGDKAFYKCTALTKITITKNVTTIGKQSFYGCKKLKTITIQSKKLKKVGTKAIKGIYKKATIKCPGKKYVTKYKKLFKSKTGFTKSMKLKK